MEEGYRSRPRARWLAITEGEGLVPGQVSSKANLESERKKRGSTNIKKDKRKTIAQQKRAVPIVGPAIFFE